MNESLFGKLLIGTSGPFAAIVISLATVNQWLQFVSLFLGCIIALRTIWGWRKNKK